MIINQSDKNQAPIREQTTTPLDWFDIDSFLDDYVNDTGAQGDIGEINLDFSLPFPQSTPQNVKTTPVPLPMQLDFPHLQTMPTKPDPIFAQIPSDSDQASDHDETPIRLTRNAGNRKRGAPATAKGEPRATAAQKKHLALQEKNRRAQRRFRERQKQRVSELEEQVAALTAQLTATVMERDALAHRNRELESTTSNARSSKDHRDAFSDAHSNPPSLSNTTTNNNNNTAPASGPSITINLKAGAEPITLTANDLATLSAPQMSSYFCTMVKELAKTVVDSAGNPDTERHIREFVDHALTLWSRVSHHNPATARTFAVSKLDEKQQGPPADERTPHILRVLGLTDRQKSELCALRRLFLQRVATISTARSNATSKHTGSIANGMPFNGTSGRAMAVTQLAAGRAAKHMESSLLEEHSTVVEFENAVLRHVMTPGQVAQLLIQSYPYPPDCLALATWVAAESGEAEALGALAADARVRAATAAAATAAATTGATTGATAGTTTVTTTSNGSKSPPESSAMKAMNGVAAGGSSMVSVSPFLPLYSSISG